MKAKISGKVSTVIKQFVLFLSIATSSTAYVEEAVIINPSTRFHPVYSMSGMVVSQEAVASHIGADILSKGGNAIDAAVATGFALSVTLPRAGNLAGGGFMMIHLAEQDRLIALDFREMAPSLAGRDMFIGDDGNVDNNLARYSIKSSGVPGSVAGLLHAQSKYGQLTLKEVIQPAVNIAKNGIEMTMDLAGSLKTKKSRLHKNEASKGYFYKDDGSLFKPGDNFIQKDLADTLVRIMDFGRSGFYQGKTADLIIEEMRRSGGLISYEDLKNYKVVERSPVCGTYKKNKVCAMPPPSSGGVHLIQMLNMLEEWDLQKLGHNSAAYIHRLVEVMRRAYADRSAYLGDPDFFNVPIDKITDKKYAKSLRKDIDLLKAGISTEVEPGLSLDINSLSKRIRKNNKESVETTHFSAWDQWGNVVSTTTTLNFSYGSGISVSGGGFLLNNEMDDFSAKPNSPNGFGLIGGIANAIEPKKRPLSSMTPTIVFDLNGRPLLTTGSPGGSTIITIVLQVVLNVLTFEMGIAEATAAPRIHHQWLPDRIFVESGISKDTLNILEMMGHKLSQRQSIMGSTQSIQKGPGVSIFGASDPRRDGAAAVPQRK